MRLKITLVGYESVVFPLTLTNYGNPVYSICSNLIRNKKRERRFWILEISTEILFTPGNRKCFWKIIVSAENLKFWQNRNMNNTNSISNQDMPQYLRFSRSWDNAAAVIVLKLLYKIDCRKVILLLASSAFVNRNCKLTPYFTKSRYGSFSKIV